MVEDAAWLYSIKSLAELDMFDAGKIQETGL
jgi:hypothetical protein